MRRIWHGKHSPWTDFFEETVRWNLWCTCNQWLLYSRRFKECKKINLARNQIYREQYACMRKEKIFGTPIKCQITIYTWVLWGARRGWRYGKRHFRLWQHHKSETATTYQCKNLTEVIFVRDGNGWSRCMGASRKASLLLIWYYPTMESLMSSAGKSLKTPWRKSQRIYIINNAYTPKERPLIAGAFYQVFT